jgi:hypothetical protein
MFEARHAATPTGSAASANPQGLRELDVLR